MTETNELRVGDYVDYMYSDRVSYRGFVREIYDETIILEICLTKKINEDNVLELVEVVASDITLVTGQAA